MGGSFLNLSLGNHFVEVKDEIGDHRPGGQLVAVESEVGLGLTDSEEFSGRLGIVLEGRQVLAESGIKLGELLVIRPAGRGPLEQDGKSIGGCAGMVEDAFGQSASGLDE